MKVSLFLIALMLFPGRSGASPAPSPAPQYGEYALIQTMRPPVTKDQAKKLRQFAERAHAQMRAAGKPCLSSPIAKQLPWAASSHG